MIDRVLSLEPQWVWAILTLHTVLMIWFTERGDLLGAVVAFLLAAISLFWLNLAALASIWEFCRAHLWAIPGMIGAYLVIGLAWSVFKWWEYVHERRAAYENHRSAWLSPKSLRRRGAELQDLAQRATVPEERERLRKWADACWRAAALGGHVMTEELKPLWKEHLQNEWT